MMRLQHCPDPSVEAFDRAVGLGVVRRCQAVLDAAHAALAQASRAFCCIRPYLDGDSHPFRSRLPGLAGGRGLQQRATSTLHPGPWNHSFSLSRQRSADFTCALAIWGEGVSGQKSRFSTLSAFS